MARYEIGTELVDSVTGERGRIVDTGSGPDGPEWMVRFEDGHTEAWPRDELRASTLEPGGHEFRLP